MPLTNLKRTTFAILNAQVPLQEYGAELHTYPKYGHWLMAEAPEIVAHRIKSFLRDL